MSAFLLRCLAFYQRAISPALPPRCRFFPSCSAYAAEAVTVHGAAHGSWLAVCRIVKCGPWHPGGVDLVPPSRSSSPRATPPALSRAPQEESPVA